MWPARAEPFALELLRLVEQGASIAQLVQQTGIPEARVITRLLAAAVFVARRASRHPETMAH
jgi:hypothetical protein